MITYPYNDADMVYDKITHAYTLTPEFVKRATGTDLAVVLNARGVSDRASLPSSYLRNISNVIYAFIYRASGNRFIAEYMAAKHPTARHLLKSAMLEQVLYTLANGDITKLSGLNVRNGTAMARGAVQSVAIAPVAEAYLEMPLDERTPALAYRGHLYTTKRLPDYVGEDY